MKQLKVKVAFLKKLKTNIYLLVFKSPYIAENAKPGQFLHIKVDDKLTILRRPLSIHRISADTVYLLFRVRGKGTKLLSQCKKGDTLDIIGPLGNSFDYSQLNTHNSRLILVAGGMGVAPLIFLAEKLMEIRNSKFEIRNLVLLGAKNKREVLAEQEFKKLGCKVYIATEDGSKGFKGTVTGLLKRLLAMRYGPCTVRIYACGPKEMFSEIAKVIKPYPNINCQVSFEQFMGCGLGICCGCTIETKDGYKKVCYDGPVFDINKIK
jgi:dihydroorotate dehydrogenase electron transfer subunit